MTLDEALQGLSAQFGVPPGPPEKGGRYYYRFGDTTIGLAQAQPEGFLCARSWVGTVDMRDESAVARVALGNMDLPVAPDALLGMDGAGEVYLDMRLGGEDMTHEQFLDALERLIGEAMRWKQTLGSAGEPAQQEE